MVSKLHTTAWVCLLQFLYHVSRDTIKISYTKLKKLNIYAKRGIWTTLWYLSILEKMVWEHTSHMHIGKDPSNNLIKPCNWIIRSEIFKTLRGYFVRDNSNRGSIGGFIDNLNIIEVTKDF